ncbi:MAG TPA: acetylglutamate kinase [Holophagaceae bacterium]|nr:acetylglutamate kinase [Holophagaceae bacterium]
MPFAANPYATLKSAAQYVRRFRNKTFVVKLGGELLADPKARKAACEQIALLWSFSIKVVVVHGGGGGLDELCDRLDIPVAKVAGRRITSAEVLEAAKMVFAGSLHTDLLAELRACGLPAVGLSGVDAGLISAVKRPLVDVDGEATDFGLVGDIESVDPAVLQHLLDGNFVPVVAPLSGDDAGAVFNTNADTIAAEVAAALQAERLFFLLGVPGLLRDLANPASLLSQATLGDLAILESDGIIGGGMRPKAAAIKKALQGGVQAAHLVSGTASDALLVEVFTNEGSGTMILADEPAAAGVAP